MQKDHHKTSIKASSSSSHLVFHYRDTRFLFAFSMLKALIDHVVPKVDHNLNSQEKENVLSSDKNHNNPEPGDHLIPGGSVLKDENQSTGEDGSSRSFRHSSASQSPRNRRGKMGNTASSSAVSCASGLGESRKTGALTTVASQEELSQYAMTQELLEKATSLEEASRISRSMSHSDSLGSLTPASPKGRFKTLFRADSTASNSSSSSSKRRSFRGLRKNGLKVLDRIASAFHSAGNAVGSKLNEVEGIVFPHAPQVGSSSIRSSAPTLSVTPKVRGGVLLRGCLDDEEHKQLVRQSIAIMKDLKGGEGLRAVGLEFRSVPIAHGDDKHGKSIHSEVPGLTEADDRKEREEDETTTATASSTGSEESESLSTMTRLFHAESNTMITLSNRKEFIADGDFYDQVARLCQEYAQEVMIREGNLEWVTVCEAGNNPEPIRALVSKTLSKDEANLDKMLTLLIATGKGKVRAGIFSRQHLIVSGMECSTAIPIVREANKRKMNVVMLDPNVHGDRLGMVTFEKSMARLFRRWESDDDIVVSSDQPPLANRDLYVLSHSQSGAQFARYLLEKSHHYVPHIRAVAFTDSTHNIQWARDNSDLHQLLQSDNCVYFKCSKEGREEVLAPLETTGKAVETDQFWEHRFGKIQTKCAGTTEHSLTNWFARYHIWDHFDQFLPGTSKHDPEKRKATSSS